MTEPGHILLFEPEHSGHQPSFVRMLVNHVRNHGQGLRLTLAVHPSLIARILSEEDAAFSPDSQIRLLELTDSDAQQCSSGPLAARAWARWRLFTIALQHSRASHGHFLYFDHMQLPLTANLFLTRGPSISGILFRPSLHEIYDTGDAILADRLRAHRKRLLYRTMLRNPRVVVAFSLDPFFVEFAHRSLPCGEKVLSLPDPIASLRSPHAAMRPAEYSLANGGRVKATFLLFGALTERKGVCKLLDAVSALDEETRGQLRLVFAGRMDEPTRIRVRAILNQHPSLRELVLLIDRFLTSQELQWAVSHCDVVLAPYQRFVGSSGVLIWAAAHRKPVLAQSYGLVGALTRMFKLGPDVDSSCPAALADAIALLLDPAVRARYREEMRFEAFLRGRTPDDFADTWLSAILPHVAG